MSTQPNQLTGYETIFITRNELTDDALKALNEKVSGIVRDYNGENIIDEDWGKRRLAYPIQKENRGQYTYRVYTGKEGVVAEIERNLRIQEHVLRFLTVQLSEEFDADAFRAQRIARAQQLEQERKERQERQEQRRFDSDRGGRYDGDRDHRRYDGDR